MRGGDGPARAIRRSRPGDRRSPFQRAHGRRLLSAVRLTGGSGGHLDLQALRSVHGRIALPLRRAGRRQPARRRGRGIHGGAEPAGVRAGRDRRGRGMGAPGRGTAPGGRSWSHGRGERRAGPAVRGGRDPRLDAGSAPLRPGAGGDRVRPDVRRPGGSPDHPRPHGAFAADTAMVIAGSTATAGPRRSRRSAAFARPTRDSRRAPPATRKRSPAPNRGGARRS